MNLRLTVAVAISLAIAAFSGPGAPAAEITATMEADSVVRVVSRGLFETTITQRKGFVGSFDVLLDDGINRKVVNLNRPYFGLYLPRRIWRELLNFSSGGICLVLASEVYDEADYYRDYDEFVRDARALREKI